MGPDSERERVKRNVSCNINKASFHIELNSFTFGSLSPPLWIYVPRIKKRISAAPAFVHFSPRYGSGGYSMIQIFPGQRQSSRPVNNIKNANNQNNAPSPLPIKKRHYAGWKNQGMRCDLSRNANSFFLHRSSLSFSPLLDSAVVVLAFWLACLVNSFHKATMSSLPSFFSTRRFFSHLFSVSS